MWDRLLGLARSFAAQAVLEVSIELMKKLGVEEEIAEDMINRELFEEEDYVDAEEADLPEIEVELEDGPQQAQSNEPPKIRLTGEFEELMIATNGEFDIYAICAKVIDTNNRCGWLPYQFTKRVPTSERSSEPDK